MLQIMSVATILVAVTLLGWELARHFTEEDPLPWRFKPFNCRACLTFWLVLGLQWLAVSTLAVWWLAGIAALISAFSAFFIFKAKYKIFN